MAETGKHFKAAQIVNLLREIDAITAGGESLLGACKKTGISENSYHIWHRMYGGLNEDMARKFDELEAENAILKKRVAELSLLEAMHKALPEKPVPSRQNANFDLSALSTNIEKQLEEVRQGASMETKNSVLSEFEAQLITTPVANHATSSLQPPQEDKSESRLFAKLAQQAQVKAVAKQSVPHARAQPAEHYTKARHLNETLGRIAKYLDPLAQHVKKAEPHINRSYLLDPQTVFANLTCRTAHSDSRKQYLSESALLDHVLLSVILCAPAPVEISQPWDTFEVLKEQLDKLKLRSLEDVDLLGKELQLYKLRLQTIDDMDLLGQVQQANKLKLQTFEGLNLLETVLQDDLIRLHLAPDFPMHIQFKANYEEDCIDVHTLNIEAFGLVTYKLKVEDVTPELMDGIGLFLLDHTDKLPAALQRVQA